ncbi:MAG: hypothetical protein ACK48B_03510, partial [Dolichospermum sp.]
FMGLLEQFSAEEIKVLNDTHLPTDELLINNSQFITQELVTQPNTELANDIPQELRKTEQN